VICAEAALCERTGGGATLRGERLQLRELPYRAMLVADEERGLRPVAAICWVLKDELCADCVRRG
jgi:hypothetical protein